MNMAYYLIQEMLKATTSINPDYPSDIEIDGKALLKIAEFIYKQMGLTHGAENHTQAIVPVWVQLYTVAYNDPFYKDKSLATIANHIQEFFQKAKNGPQGQISNTKLKHKLAARLGKRR